MFEAAGEVALVGEAAVAGDDAQILRTRQELGLGGVDLAFEQVLLGCQAEQLGKAAMKVEGAEFDFAWRFRPAWGRDEIPAA